MVTGSQATPVFQLVDPTLAATLPAIADVWATETTTTTAAVSFAVNAATADAATVADVPIWRANFPANVRQATTYLTASEGRLRQSQQALETVGDRIQHLLRSLEWGADCSFTVPFATVDQSQPEWELLALVQTLQQRETPISFGLSEEMAGFSGRTVAQFQSFVNHLLQVVAHYAWIETRFGDYLLARTSVGWLGEVTTIWQTGLTAEQALLHQRTLALALASRDRLLQILAITLQTTLKLSTLVSLPGGLILVLPAVWQCVDRILSQFRES